jgi:hypothetical protein
LAATSCICTARAREIQLSSWWLAAARFLSTRLWYSRTSPRIPAFVPTTGAGLGWASPGPADETVEQTIVDLHEPLRAAGEKGPYPPVGESIAGIYMQGHPRVYAEDVVGLVFTNSSHRVGLQAKGKAASSGI